MYTEADNHIFYSQRHLNEPKYCKDHGYGGTNGAHADVLDYNGASHTATFYGEYTDWLYLCFEDWYETEYSDMDLNDMVCRLTPTTLTTKTTTEIELENKSFTWLIAAEDLGTTDDFDFNDMVVAVSSLPTTDVGNNNASFSIVQFTALAAGGTLPLYLHLVGKPLYIREEGSSTNVSSCTRGTLSDGTTPDYVLYPDNKDASSAEWHKWFGNGEYSSSTMINTTSAGYTVKGMTSTVYLQDTYTITQYGKVDTTTKTIDGFCITVNSQDLVSNDEDPSSLTKQERYNLTPAEKGSAPQMFVILDQSDGSNSEKDGWRWPIERHDIMDAYQYFQPWAADHTTNQNWHKDPTASEVIAARSTTHKTTYTGSIPGGGGGGGTTPTVTTYVVYEDATGTTFNDYGWHEFASNDLANLTTSCTLVIEFETASYLGICNYDNGENNNISVSSSTITGPCSISLSSYSDFVTKTATDMKFHISAYGITITKIYFTAPASS